MASIAAGRPQDIQNERGNPHWTRPPRADALDPIPGTDGWPLVGTTITQLADPIGFAERMAARYGPVYRTRSFGRRMVNLVGADANELVLFDRERIFSSEQGWGPVLNLLFPRGLMLLDFDMHRLDRRALSAAFKPEPMRNYCALLNADIARGTQSWGAGAAQTGTMAFYPAIKALTLETAATSFLGLPLGPEADRLNSAFVDMVQASIAPVRRPLPFTAMGKGVAGRRMMVAYFTQLLRQRRADPGQDMFSQFALATRDDGALLPEDLVVDHMIFLMMAAHDTITSSMTGLIWQLAQHPEWQEKLRGEARAAAGGDARPLPFEALGQMVLTEMAFKEALRILPPVPATPRRALKDFSFGGFRIPAGTGVGISAASIHADPAHWPDPARFDPLRFTAEEVAKRHKYAWVPFGGGAHMCLGLHFAYMQVKVLVHHILTRYELGVAPGYAPAWQAWPIPKPRDGLQLRLRPLL
ncbi:cytochrome P450 [Novosphingobium sp. Chol11]|uniref:cytochrome P450 n=1 Tax=Novosphingobium sp. Chol11 TaxID=1385763 RepID=UPI0025CCA47F|nr:cytochrome P450 [Novosphingobium sp. Chol11]